MGVPLLDLKAQWKQVGDECRAAMEPVLDSAYYVMGPQVKQLEEEVAAYSGANFGIGCANGSDAIVLALLALGVGPGDEVILPTFTFFATAGAVSRVGAKPVFADCDPLSYNLLPSEIERLATPNTKAVIPVHLFGQCCDMDAINDIAKGLGIRVIEDAAQSIGSQYKGRRVGQTGGDIATYSFFPSKNLGCLGDGGMCVTNDQELADLMGILRVHGSKPKYYHKYIGFNSRLDSLQAAVLSVKLRYLDEWHEGRRRNAADYSAKLAGVEGLALPQLAEYGSGDGKEPYHIYNQYTIRVTNGRRDAVVAGMKERGIGCEVYYPVCLHEQECYASLGYSLGDLPNSEAAAREVLSVPIYPELTAALRDEVVGALKELVRTAATVSA
jgi:dTDP-4-amino-4,6-dideoxygalactose transaminase